MSLSSEKRTRLVFWSGVQKHDLFSVLGQLTSRVSFSVAFTAGICEISEKGIPVLQMPPCRRHQRKSEEVGKEFSQRTVESGLYVAILLKSSVKES